MLRSGQTRGWLEARRSRRAPDPPGEARALTRADVPPAMLPATVAGPPVTARESLTVVDVWGAVSAIARTASQMPPILYRPQGDGRERVRAGTGAELLRRPAPGMTPAAFVASAVLHVCLWGEVFVGKVRQPDGSLAFLMLLSPDAMEVDLAPTGEPVYAWNGGKERRILSRADVAHGMLMTIDGRRGISPVAMCREGIGLNRALAQHASAHLANGGAPKGVLTVDAGPATDDVARNLMTDWAARHGGPLNAGRVAIVGGEVSFAPVSMPLADQQFLEQRNLSTNEVCRIWGLPPWAVGANSGDGLRYENAESQALGLIKYCVASYVRPLEEALSGDEELAPGDEYVELLAEGVLRGASSERAAFYEKALDPAKGWMNRDEVRRAESLPAESADQRPNLTVVPKEAAR
jgi:HK97 family phage portal protein